MSAHPTVRKLFEGRKAVVVSMHGKHYAMKPLIKQYLNIDTVVVPDFDTDVFGTFSGEVERPFDPVTTLRRKILSGLEAAGEKLGIGNEGSFFPHPQIPFIQANQEIVMLIDLENNIEITESVISTETNHHEMRISCIEDLHQFAECVHFPSHGVILKQVQGGKPLKIEKGIVTWEHLQSTYKQFSIPALDVMAETDMRGHMNPTRMRIIERATKKLMKKLTNICPQCQWVGFGVVEVKPGLPCKLCNHPTNLSLLKVYQCQHCQYKDERYYLEGQEANPQYCDRCNP